MKNKKIYILMVCLTVVLTGCGFDLWKKAVVREVKNEQVVSKVATSSIDKKIEEVATTTVNTALWLKYDSKYQFLSQKFSYPNSLVFYEFADGMGTVVNFYNAREYEDNKCYNNERDVFTCDDLPVVMRMRIVGYEDKQDKEIRQKARISLYEGVKIIKVGIFDAYLVSGSFEDLKERGAYVSDRVVKIYIPEYNRMYPFSELEFTMALTNVYTEDVFARILKSANF
jgi:hypothetical protein